MSRAYYCETCDGPAGWVLDRRGDAVVTWACGDHLDTVLTGLQRWFERTEVTVRPMLT